MRGVRQPIAPASISPVKPWLWGQLLGAILDEIVNQLGSRVIHFDDETVDLAGKVVKEPYRRDGDYQAESRRKQRFGNAAGDGSDSCRLCVFHSSERVNDAEHGAEQAYERRRRTDSGQAGKAPAKLGGLDGDRSLQRALRRFDLLA